MAAAGARYRNTLDLTYGIMFIATPHDGANLARLAGMLANIANSAIKINTGNLKLLERDSEPLAEIANTFGYLTQLEIVTVVESEKTKIRYTGVFIIVSQICALDGISACNIRSDERHLDCTTVICTTKPW